MWWGWAMVLDLCIYSSSSVILSVVLLSVPAADIMIESGVTTNWCNNEQ